MTKLLLNKKAIQLRKEGYSIKSIAKKLKISSSTASRWCRDVKVPLHLLNQLKRQAHDPYYGKRLKNITKQKEKKVREIERLKKIGINEINKLSKREFFIAGVALYWAEGFKKDKRLGFANSDPTMIKFFLNWLINNCKVPKENIRVRVGINISHKYRLKKVEKYWSEKTNLSLNQFQKPYFQQFVWKKDFPNPEEYYGVLRIRANKQLPLFRKINGWITGLKINISDQPLQPL